MFIAHDQEEALVPSDRIAVMGGGTSVTARGLGAGRGRVRLLVRTEKMAIDSATNGFTDTVVEAVYLGEAHKLRVKVAAYASVGAAGRPDRPVGLTCRHARRR